MIWIAGGGGFILGFCFGLLLLRRWLAHKTKTELMTDKSLHVSYGLFVWMMAGITSAAAIWLFNYYF